MAETEIDAGILRDGECKTLARRRSPSASLWTLALTLALGCTDGATVGDAVKDTGVSDALASPDLAGEDIATDDSAAADSAAADSAADDSAAAETTPTDTAAGPLQQCVTDLECALADPCLGQGICHKGANVWVCATVPGSAVDCDDSLDTACLRNRCRSSDGTCQMTAAPAGTPCVDSDPCVVQASCAAGVCTPGAASWCQCQSDSDCAAIPGWDACVGAPYCDKSGFPWTCQANPAAAVACDTQGDTACTITACDPKDGACKPTNAPISTLCDDGDSATVGDHCLNGACVPTTDLKICAKNTDCDALEDGDVCNGTLYCDLSSATCKINPATIIACPDSGDSACLKNLCDAQTGACEKTFLKNGTPCDDGDACTAGDICKVGVCAAGQTYTCPCQSDADCSGKDDGNLCNGSFFCNAATKACQFLATSIVLCPSVDDSACQLNACQPKQGSCVATAAGEVVDICEVYNGVQVCHREVKAPGEATQTGIGCEDGDSCTVGDTCEGAICKPGADVCPCKVHSDCLVEDDGDRCNGVPLCDKVTGQCTKKQDYFPVVCPKQNNSDCVENTCNPIDGSCSLKPANEALPCDDDKFCTIGETCNGGKCGGAKPNPCDDGKACTQDACSESAGCLHPLACDDGNACTIEACDPKTGSCTNESDSTEGGGCNADSNGCTIGDSCVAGTCKAGPSISCKVTVDVCEVAACISTSASTFQCVAKPAQLGSACDDGDACSLDDTCGPKGCAAGKTVRLGSVDDSWGTPHGWWTAALAVADERVVLLGVESDEGPGKDGKQRAWHIQRSRPLGPAEQSATVANVGTTAAVAPLAAMQRSDGRLVVVGTIHDGKVHRVRMVGFEADWKQIYATDHVSSDVGDLVARAATAAGGGLLVSGQETGGAHARGFLAQITDKPALAAIDWIDVGQDLDLRAHCALAGGSVVAAGHTSANAVLKPWIGRVEQGKLSWQLAPLAAGFSVGGVVVDGDGVMIAAGAGANAPLTVQRITQAGVAQWSRTLAANGAVTGLLGRGPGSVLVVGAHVSQAGTIPAIAATSDQGVLYTDLQLQGVGQQLQAPTTLGGANGGLGNVLLVGARVAAGTTQPLRRAQDHWGSANCAVSGTCVTMKAIACVDASACTGDLCSGGVCSHVALAAACDDGDACTSDDGCSGGVCKPGKIVDCNDSDGCTKDSCHVVLGCTHAASGAETACDDGNACTINDHCGGASLGGCKGTAIDAGGKNGCDDNNLCTIDTCDKTKGCQHGHTDAPCADSNECTNDLCNEASHACEHPHNQLPCDDGVACSAGAVCAGGKCVAGEPDKKLWYQNFGKFGTGFAAAHAMVAAPGGGVFVGGYDVSVDNSHLETHALRIDATGKQLWHVQFGDAHVKKTGAEYVLAGTSDGKGPVFAGVSTHQSAGLDDGMVAALKAEDGSKRWLFRYGDVNHNRLLAITHTATGFGTCGYTVDPGPDGNQAWLLRLTPQGFQVGSWTYGGAGIDRCQGLVADGDAFVLAMQQAGYQNTTDTGLMKVDAAGKVVWRRTFPDLGADAAQGLVKMADGGFAIAATRNVGTANHPFIVRTDPLGQLRWRYDLGSQIWGTAKAEAPIWGIAATAQDDVLVSGFWSPYDVGYPRHPRIELIDGASGQSLRAANLDGNQANHPLSEGRIHEVVPTADGLFAAGSVGNGLAVLRMDDFYRWECSKSGACADAHEGGCDDGKPCTSAGCGPGGCTATPLNQGRVCDGSGLCESAWECDGKGSCDAVGGTLGAHKFNVDAGDIFWTVVPSVMGGWLAGGSTLKVTIQGQSEVGRGHIARLDGSGRVIDGYAYLGDHTSVEGLAELPDGRVVALAHLNPAADKRVMVAVLNSQLSVVDPSVPLTAPNPQAAEVHRLHGPLQIGDEEIVAAGDACINSTCSPWIVRMRVDGSHTVTLNKRLSGTGQQAAITRIGADIATAGSDDKGFASVRRVGLDGALVWSTSLGGASGGLGKAIALTNAGDLVVAGRWPVGGSDAGMVARVSANGSLLWAKSMTAKNADNLRGIAALNDGQIAVVGTAGTTTTDGVLAMLTPAGTVVRSELYDGGKNDFLMAVLPTADGGVLAVGAAGDYYSRDFYVVRANAWGHDSCAVAGFCADQSASSCDDGDACTADSCVAAKGCVHEPVACP